MNFSTENLQDKFRSFQEIHKEIIWEKISSNVQGSDLERISNQAIKIFRPNYLLERIYSPNNNELNIPRTSNSRKYTCFSIIIIIVLIIVGIIVWQIIDKNRYIK